MIPQKTSLSARPGSILDYAIWPGWRLLMQDAGLATAPVLRRAQLPGDLFSRDNVRLTPAMFFDLWLAIEAEARSIDAQLPAPLRIARVMTSDWFDPELFAALCSANLGNALDRIGSFVKLIAPMVIGVERGKTQANVTIGFLDQTKPPPNVFLAFKLVFFVQLARLATRTPVVPLQVGWPLSDDDSEADRALYAEFFGRPVKVTAAPLLVFSMADIERPFLTENHKLWEFFEPSLRQRLADLDRTASMVERVRSALLEALPAGEVAMQAVSKRLGVSSRTLQRRLHEEGTTFQHTLDKVRAALAEHYLRKTMMSSAEIALLLGFEDTNSFVRAFRLWTGKTPQAVRRDPP
ncbi:MULTISPECIES: AraC family transcriptional regulator [Xanthomonas]|jgi:AraC-like DNA-binding protein|uniref:AraC family transcriptional regulator n=3 Tax=Xanthomonas dyei TaxID=743699 RepID=A0ABZ0DFF4_9XANT|nr:AraC family transcriptional regulator [Xanthomonas dyei]MCC4634437.1 AraC family transcriptional regulator [Xanthomonas dyei pv. eucalypti]WOB26555.1 AraC family transcriptional regulator [Xanthomonas dyei]WOB54174.1 AraC family transcriptional regulator [Xanthomonas dyei]